MNEAYIKLQEQREGGKGWERGLRLETQDTAVYTGGEVDL